ncbi:MAG: response regulator [Deltaproteobacteria bacterium]|nr:response regulator [Deltaproteobacteria bacterium]
MDNKNKTISLLVVDDEPACLRVLRRLLADEFAVTTADSAKEALGLVCTESFNVVLTDYDMPEKGGLWLLRVIRQHYPEIHRVLISGCPPTDIANHLQSGLADFCLPKPSSRRQIVDCLRSLAQQGSPTRHHH